jgi:DNA-binding XRE family transcriptional regulator
MSTTISCYLRTHRRRWSLSQREVALLVGGSGRNRVSLIERGIASPNALEILAYPLIFGSSVRAIFPSFHEQCEDAVMRCVYGFHKRLAEEDSASAQLRRKLIEQIFARATKEVRRSKRPNP